FVRQVLAFSPRVGLDGRFRGRIGGEEAQPRTAQRVDRRGGSFGCLAGSPRLRRRQFDQQLAQRQLRGPPGQRVVAQIQQTAGQEESRNHLPENVPRRRIH